MKRPRGQRSEIATTRSSILATAMRKIIATAMRTVYIVDFYMTKYLSKAQEALELLIPAVPLRKLMRQLMNNIDENQTGENRACSLTAGYTAASE